MHFQDQVKIQKWDEQSYYSLKASAEKSHAVLHKLVCEFDEVLRSPVATLLDAELEGFAVRPSESRPTLRRLYQCTHAGDAPALLYSHTHMHILWVCISRRA